MPMSNSVLVRYRAVQANVQLCPLVNRSLWRLAVLSVMLLPGEIFSEVSDDLRLSGAILTTHYFHPDLDMEVSISAGREIEIRAVTNFTQLIVI